MQLPALLLLALAASVTACGYDAKELSYDPAIGHDGTFFVYEPKSDTARTDRPAILAIHGGGLRAGDKAWADQFAKEFCPGRFVVFSINYRLTTRPNGKWPAQIEDVQKALRYIRANARHPGPWSDAELHDISTVTFARPDVSVLTIHGAGDDDVSVAQGDRLTAVLRAKGADTEFIRLEGNEGNCHSDCWKAPRAREALHRFLARKLGT